MFYSCKRNDKIKKESNFLRVCLDNDAQTVDPRKSFEQYSSHVIFMLFDGLFKNLPDGSIIPGVAKSYEISDDKMTYVFHLRDSYWSDGYAVTAEDFEFAYKSALNPSFPCGNVQLLFPILNAEAITQKRVSPEKLGIKALDERTLEIKLESPTPYFPKLLCFCNLFPIPSHIAKKDPEWSCKTDQIICNGPFKLKKWARQEKIIFEKNSMYWDADNVTLDGIELLIIKDGNTALEMFHRQEIDFMQSAYANIPEVRIPLLDPKIKHWDYLDASIALFFQTEKPPFHNKNLRKAFSLALNRKELVKVTQKEDVPAFTFINPILLNNAQENLIKDNDPLLAKKFLNKGLQEVGMTKEDLSKIPIFYATHSSKKLVEAIQQQFEKVLGIRFSMVFLDLKMHMGKLNKKSFQIAIGAWIPQIGDAINILDRFKYRTNTKNYSSWENEKYAQLINDSMLEIDSLKREAIMMQAESVLIEELPFTPILHAKCLSLVQPYLKNYYLTYSGGLRFEKVSLEVTDAYKK